MRPINVALVENMDRPHKGIVNLILAANACADAL